DLILLKLSPEEVLEIRNELSYDFVREYLGLCYGYSLDKMLRKASPKQIIDMCKKWKADHEKKEPEVEWVYKGVADTAVATEIEFFNTENEAREWCERRTIETGLNHAYIPVCRVKE
ncbi:MAG: hypothetical protein J6A75_02600, partial [Lachnospiraceae bacterium]|nr:hypothetical protein [Lachnospiraceae bacterium]